MNHRQVDLGNLPLAEQIQLTYPEEPDWDKVDSKTLVALVEDFVMEQSCAAIAIGHLATQRHERAVELASWLLEQECADEWLKASALGVLAAE